MKGVCERWTPPLAQDTPAPALLQPSTSSRAGSPLASTSPHAWPLASCRGWGAGFSLSGSPLEENATRRMFTKLGPPPPAPPAASCKLWKRNSRSTRSSSLLPRDHTLYLKEARDNKVSTRPETTKGLQFSTVCEGLKKASKCEAHIESSFYLVGRLLSAMDGSTGWMSRCCGLESWRWSSALVTVSDRISLVRRNSTSLSGEDENKRQCQSHGPLKTKSISGHRAVHAHVGLHPDKSQGSENNL